MSPHVAASKVSRRQAIKIGGLSVSVAALVAACGDDREGDTSPGRVGYAPPVTEPPDYAVDDAVLLRTASSLEYTLQFVYDEIIGAAEGLDPALADVLARVQADRETTIETLAGLTEDVGGVAWTCTNEWMMERLVQPVQELIAESDDPARDAYNLAVALENLAAATHQVLAVELSEATTRVAALEIATLESRHAAALVISVRGADGYISPAVFGEGVPTDESGVPETYAVTDRFGSVGQTELTIGPPDENGARESFILQTPAENSYVYNELEPTC